MEVSVIYKVSYFPINNEPGFSFQPPDINEDISFQISTQTLSDDMNYFYDVDSGSYSQIQFACGFMDGANQGLYDPSTVILNIRECKSIHCSRCYWL